MIDPFLENTIVTRNRDGSVTVKCRKGMWSVTSQDVARAIIEARHYFAQYYADGEYVSDQQQRPR